MRSFSFVRVTFVSAVVSPSRLAISWHFHCIHFKFVNGVSFLLLLCYIMQEGYGQLLFWRIYNCLVYCNAEVAVGNLMQLYSLRLCNSLHKILGIKELSDASAYKLILGLFKEPLSREVTFLYSELSVYRDNIIGADRKSDICQSFRNLAHIRQTHIKLGLVLEDGNCLVAAGSVAAAAAVQLMRRSCLAYLRQN